jgi:hypothetical protein
MEENRDETRGEAWRKSSKGRGRKSAVERHGRNERKLPDDEG